MIKLNEITKCEKLFGKELFGHKEEDTPLENKVYKDLLTFFNGDWTRKDKIEIEKTFDLLLKCKNQYPNELKPESNTLYRGIKIEKSLVSNLPKDVEKVTLKDSSGYITTAAKKYKKQFIYKPKSIIQSWTTSIKVAEDFAVNHVIKSPEPLEIRTSKYYPCIIEATFPENELLMNSRKSEDISGFFEREVIRKGGDIKCNLYVTPFLIKSLDTYKKEYLD